MKVCERCGVEIFTKDGENRCSKCEGKARTSKKAKEARRQKDQILRDLGLKKVRGALGGQYWE